MKQSTKRYIISITATFIIAFAVLRPISNSSKEEIQNYYKNNEITSIHIHNHAFVLQLSNGETKTYYKSPLNTLQDIELPANEETNVSIERKTYNKNTTLMLKHIISNAIKY